MFQKMFRKFLRITLVLLLLNIVAAIGLFSVDPVVIERVIYERIRLFSADLQKVIRETEEKNFLLSSISLWFLLSMISNGSKGRTKTQILSALHLHDSYNSDEIRRFDENLIKRYNGSFTSKDSWLFELNMANMIFVNNSWDLQIPFFESIKRKDRSTIDGIDFTNTEKAYKAINYWSNYQTKAEIKNVFANGDLTSDTGLILTSVVSLKARWKGVKDRRYYEDFSYNFDGRSRKIPVLIAYNNWIHGQIPHGQAEFIVIPLIDAEINMIVILPKPQANMNSIAEDLELLTPSYFLEGTRRYIKLILPKFKFTSRIELKEPLVRMGMTDIFTRSTEFGVTSESPKEINKIVQKVSIDISDEFSNKSSDYGFVSNKIDFASFKVERPFFVIVCTKEVVLFNGLITDPTIKNNY